jgi:hypothetical protein
MTRDEIRAYVRAHPIDWPPFSEAQRLRLAVLLRPDLPVGIQRPAVTQTPDPPEGP